MRLLSNKALKGKKEKLACLNQLYAIMTYHSEENLNLNYILNKRVTGMDFFYTTKKNL